MTNESMVVMYLIMTTTPETSSYAYTHKRIETNGLKKNEK